MTWKATFDKGVACFKRGDLEAALAHMNQAAELESSAFIVFDSRAAVHEKLGNIKAALLDSKRVIDLAPDRWQGYARSARLFDHLEKYDSAIKMVDHALNHLRPEDVQRHAQFLELREKVVAAAAAAEKQRSSQIALSSYLLGKLPVETLVEIFSLLIHVDHTWAMKLSHVCGHWRQILINTPSAWQTLVLSKKYPLRKVKLWKQRTKNRVARISLHVPNLDTTSVLTELKDLSWENVSSLRASDGVLLELYQILSEISIPHVFAHLSELVLFGCSFSYLLPGSSCSSGPNWKLRTLHLTGVVHMRDEWWQRIRQLRELHVSGNNVRFSVPMFSANPLLEKFALKCPVREDSNMGDDTFSAPMDNLKYVELQEPNPFPVMRTITTPSITHFSMSTASTMADETLLHIAAHPSLVELRISTCSLGPSTLPMLLSSTPNLETLQINSVQGVVNQILDFLSTATNGSSQGLPCRALKLVDVSRCSDLTTSRLYAFVKTRVQYASEPVESTAKCAVIASLNVDGCPNIEDNMLPWFRSKVAQFSCVYATKKDLKKDRRRHPQ